MKEAAWLLSTALPEDGRRMIKGPGRSACFRGGVTYGYREYLRKGRIRQKLRRKFVGHSWIDGLAKSFLSAKRCLRAFCSHPRFISVIPSQNHFAVFLW
ncbi:hypothetical protein V466_21830 [Pseudomonas mandelii PD30]|uniref:Uncharacterized protein n=1 Tax=Pseudomonas mandelii PD30 TaxID=1419583 RepID=A0A059KXZ9_9PSED|nr:hypothetical protein V466_21830 [Pseudomonas mandelii PD30]